MEAEIGVDLPSRRNHTKLRYDPNCGATIFELGMIFENVNQFRKPMTDYAIEYHSQLKLKPNESTRVRVKYKSKICHRELFASFDRDSGNFIVKKYHPIHKCTPMNKNKLCNSKAKQIVLRKFMGDWKMEFARLCDYTDIIIQTYPGSICLVKTDRNSEPGKNLFKYFYDCFDALKKGWLEGCRKIIGFDGYFLKGACKGELLVAIGKNENQQMYPIVWPVIDNESKTCRSWFINNLISDLELGDGARLTVMSNMHKGNRNEFRRPVLSLKLEI
ncbi:uncharacterized protein [Nicotiana sylvestris]|uniref:uncharacterized protein n=1 Tax=Nicotiana sylvestris TaxID=4096 RepID=UPI00388C6A14